VLSKDMRNIEIPFTSESRTNKLKQVMFLSVFSFSNMGLAFSASSPPFL